MTTARPSSPNGLALALVANPDAGAAERFDVAAELRRLGAEVREFGLDAVDEALATRPDRVVVAGGDGSLACVAAPSGRAGIPVAVVPTGTANDFARALGLPADPAGACGLAVSGSEIRRVDLGWMEERPFLNVSSLGLPPAAARRAAGLKARLGPLAYVVGALRAGLRARPVRCRVSCDGEPLFAGSAWQVTVACSGVFGAGSSVGADPRDGLLDVVVIEATRRAQLVRHVYGLRTGRIGSQALVRKRRCHAARVELGSPTDFNVDGELVRSSSCGFRSDPDAFAMVVG